MYVQYFHFISFNLTCHSSLLPLSYQLQLTAITNVQLLERLSERYCLREIVFSSVLEKPQLILISQCHVAQIARKKGVHALHNFTLNCTYIEV